MTTTQITNIAHLLDLTDYVNEFAGDYDMDAVHRDYVAAVERSAGDGITICGNGDVIADVDVADKARDIDWGALVEEVDIDAILQRHDVSEKA